MSLTRKEPWQNKANSEQPGPDLEAKLCETKPICPGTAFQRSRLTIDIDSGT